MPKSNLLKVILLVSLMIIIAFPLYAYLYQHPSFTGLLKENVYGQVSRIATYLSMLLITEENALTKNAVSDLFLRQVKEIEKDQHVIKLKIFLPSGEILYSSNPQEIGTINREEYFQEIVALSKSRMKEIGKGAQSLERQIMPADVVETYVPIMMNNQVIGIFEVYYDISAENAKLNALMNRSSGFIFILALVLVAIAILSIYRADEYLQRRKRAEDEKEKLIKELQGALHDIKILRGLLPICSTCKKIRDDTGYWSQIESYIRKHSEAEFTHSYCPDCYQKVMEELDKEG